MIRDGNVALFVILLVLLLRTARTENCFNFIPANTTQFNNNNNRKTLEYLSAGVIRLYAIVDILGTSYNGPLQHNVAVELPLANRSSIWLTNITFYNALKVNGTGTTNVTIEIRQNITKQLNGSKPIRVCFQDVPRDAIIVKISWNFACVANCGTRNYKLSSDFMNATSCKEFCSPGSMVTSIRDRESYDMIKENFNFFIWLGLQVISNAPLTACWEILEDPPENCDDGGSNLGWKNGTCRQSYCPTVSSIVPPATAAYFAQFVNWFGRAVSTNNSIRCMCDQVGATALHQTSSMVTASGTNFFVYYPPDPTRTRSLSISPLHSNYETSSPSNKCTTSTSARSAVTKSRTWGESHSTPNSNNSTSPTYCDTSSLTLTKSRINDTTSSLLATSPSSSVSPLISLTDNEINVSLSPTEDEILSTLTASRSGSLLRTKSLFLVDGTSTVIVVTDSMISTMSNSLHLRSSSPTMPFLQLSIENDTNIPSQNLATSSVVLYLVLRGGIFNTAADMLSIQFTCATFSFSNHSVSEQLTSLSMYLLKRVNVTMDSPTVARLLLSQQSELFQTFLDDVVVHGQLKSQCLRDAAILKFSFTIRRTILPAESKAVVPQMLINAASGVSVAAGAVNPAIAVQATRSTLALRLAFCVPAVDELDWLDSPTRVRFGAQVPYYVGGCIMNHILLLAVFLVQMIVVAVHLVPFFFTNKKKNNNNSSEESTIQFSVELRKGLAAARFSSLLSFPLMALMQPTVTCSVVVLLYADSGYKVLASGSLLVSAVVPLYVGWYLFKNKLEWVYDADYRVTKDQDNTICVGEEDQKQNGGRHVGEEDEGVELASLMLDPASSDVSPRPVTASKINTTSYMTRMMWFFAGTSKWMDAVDGSRFCHRHRLFFKDYQGQYYWFIVVEMFMCMTCGVLDGVKLGSGHCNPIIILAVVLFSVYLVLMCVLRPYNSYFLLLFSIVMTFLQLLGFVFLAINQLKSVAAAMVWAETAASISLYVLMIRTVVDVTPLIIRLVTFFLCEPRRRAAAKSIETLRGEPISLGRNLIDTTAEVGSRGTIHAEESVAALSFQLFGVKHLFYEQQTPSQLLNHILVDMEVVKGTTCFRGREHLGETRRVLQSLGERLQNAQGKQEQQLDDVGDYPDQKAAASENKVLEDVDDVINLLVAHLKSSVVGMASSVLQRQLLDTLDERRAARAEDEKMRSGRSLQDVMYLASYHGRHCHNNSENKLNTQSEERKPQSNRAVVEKDVLGDFNLLRRPAHQVLAMLESGDL